MRGEATTTKAGNTRVRWGAVLQRRRLTGEHPLRNSLIPFAPRLVFYRIIYCRELRACPPFLPPVSPPQTLGRNTRRRTPPCYWWIPPLWNISTSRHEFIAHQLDPLYLVLFMINPHWYPRDVPPVSPKKPSPQIGRYTDSFFRPRRSIARESGIRISRGEGRRGDESSRIKTTIFLRMGNALRMGGCVMTYNTSDRSDRLLPGKTVLRLLGKRVLRRTIIVFR